MFRLVPLALAAILPASPTSALIGNNGLIFAAASLKGPLDKAVARLVKEGRCIIPGGTIRVSYASSGILARQIQFGAPADLFISADRAWIDHLVKRGSVHHLPAYNRAMLTNRLVVIGDGPHGRLATLKAGTSLAARLGKERLAIGDPGHVPAGRYARVALQKLGLWKVARRNAVLAPNVRVALAYVARKEVGLGIVYETDAAASSGVRIIGRVPGDAHPPIRYVAAITKSGEAKCARFWLDRLMSAPYRKIFTDAGYGLPGGK